MGALVKFMDALLFIFLLVIAFKIPLLKGQACLPVKYYPDYLVELRSWYIGEVNDYLMKQMPDFYVGIVWLELLFQWPLVLVNLYAILAGKKWFNTTCLSYGISLFTAMVPILAELRISARAPQKLLTVYSTLLSLGVVCILRGLVPNSSSNKFYSEIIGHSASSNRKKRV